MTNADLKQAIATALSSAKQGKMVVFGIQPTAPKTGYGYIKKGESLGEVFNVQCFVEKPSADKAEAYLTQGDFYWNSGMFLFSATTYLNELKMLANDIYAESFAAFNTSTPQNDFFRADKSFAECRSGSIDYEVMEKTDKAVMLPLALAWNDLGCWAAVAESGQADELGNVIRGDNTLLRHSENCLISSEKRRVIGIGMLM